MTHSSPSKMQMTKDNYVFNIDKSKNLINRTSSPNVDNVFTNELEILIQD